LDSLKKKKVRKKEKEKILMSALSSHHSSTIAGADLMRSDSTKQMLTQEKARPGIWKSKG
jgi:hypothetical protein